MKADLQTLLDYLALGPQKLVLSNPRKKSEEFRKIQIRSVEKGYFVEKYTKTQAFHETIERTGLGAYLQALPLTNYRQLDVWEAKAEHHVLIGKTGEVHWTKKENGQSQENSMKMLPKTQNRQKTYLLPEGVVVAPLVDLGIFTKEGKVVRSMYDKYRQINRFLEILHDEAKRLPAKDVLRVIDFGCGKSYLTFVVYYYFTHILGRKVEILGLDLKEEVIKHCNEAAKKYGYDNLRFEMGDIRGYQTDKPVDVVMTLHACDMATDYALWNAISWEAELILSVPCCQHELNKQMQAKELSILTRYGIVQERIASCMTDAIRGNLLQYCGYQTKLLEFVDFTSTPKNLLIRATRTRKAQPRNKKYLEEVEQLMEQFSFSPCLYRLLKQDGRL